MRRFSGEHRGIKLGSCDLTRWRVRFPRTSSTHIDSIGAGERQELQPEEILGKTQNRLTSDQPYLNRLIRR